MKKDLNLKVGRILDGRFNEGLFEESWFHGEISCDEAEAILSLENLHGSFLVRNVGSLYIFSFVRIIQHKVNIKHLKVPSSRAHGLLKENPGLKTEYELIRYILFTLGCKYFLHPVNRSKNVQPIDFKIVKIDKEEKEFLKCKLCDDIAKSLGDANQHKATHTLSFCQICKEIVLLNNQTDHKRRCDPDFLLKCEICSKYETKFPSSLKLHKKTCQSLIKCSTCDKSFTSEKALQNHAIRVHKKRELARVPCDLCGSILSSASKVAMHKQAIHNIIEKENRYQCPNCDFKTPYKQLLGKHLNTHKHKYQCNDCFFSTNKQLHIEKHNALFHKYLIPIKEKKREQMIIIAF